MITIKQFKPTSHKAKALIYGASGSGKTTFAGGAEKVIFASAEGGLLSIASKLPNYVEIKSLQDLKDFYLYLKTQKHDFETVVIDSITEINDIIKIDIEKKTGKAMQLQDWGTLSKEIRNIFRSFRDLPMHVVFIAQETIDEKDENGTASKIVPSLNGKASTEIAYFMDIVGYIFVAKDGSHKVITASNARLLTKDRTGLIGNDTEPNFQAWINKINTMETGEEVVTAEYTNPASEPAQKSLPMDNAMGGTVAKVASPVKADIYSLAKKGLDKVANLTQAQNGLDKVKVVDGLNEGQRLELMELYTEKVAEFTVTEEEDVIQVD